MSRREFNTVKRKDIRDMLDEMAGCGVYGVGGPPVMQGKTWQEWLLATRGYRDEARGHVENACGDCGLNRFYFSQDAQKKILVCDAMLAATRAVPRSANRSFSATMKEYGEIHHACEYEHYRKSPHCAECPLAATVKVDVGLRSAELTLCEMYERYAPREHVAQLRPFHGDGLPLGRRGGWQNRFGGSVK